MYVGAYITAVYNRSLRLFVLFTHVEYTRYQDSKILFCGSGFNFCSPIGTNGKTTHYSCHFFFGSIPYKAPQKLPLWIFLG